MKTNKKLRVILVTLFRIFIHILTYVIFIAGFFPRYQGIRSFTRTLAVITASFTFMTAWMTYVYGKIDIGVKKTKPLFHTIALNLLITDAVTFIAVIVMTVNNKTVPFWQDLLAVLGIYIIQLIVTRILIGAANSLYFSNYTPEKTLIIHDNSDYLPKVIKYLERHQKQYEIVEVIDKRSVRDICFNELDHVFMIDMDFEFIRCVALKCMMLDVNLYYNATIAAVTLSNKETFMVDDILFFLHRTNRITLLQRIVKRIFDILISGLAIIVSSPIMLIIAIMIKLEDRGPIIYSQERITRNGEVFSIHKFRSMRQNAGESPATVNDERITKTGHIIRKIRMDELPQFFNILKGQMSIVGPRPESYSETKRIVKDLPEFTLRYKVKAGLTGTAQIFGKYNTRSKDKLLLDLYYIENFSIFNDVSLMFQTLFVFLKKDSTEGFNDNSTQ